MLTLLPYVFLSLSLACLIVGPAAAAQCARRDQVVERLERTYGEQRRGIGLAGDQQGVIEVFASDQTGTWTITVTLPSGLSCLVASGQNWSPVPISVTVPGDPT